MSKYEHAPAESITMDDAAGASSKYRYGNGKLIKCSLSSSCSAHENGRTELPRYDTIEGFINYRVVKTTWCMKFYALLPR
jgi:hypothetical protein